MGECALQAERLLGPAGRACPSAQPRPVPCVLGGPAARPLPTFLLQARFPGVWALPCPPQLTEVGFQDSPELHTPTHLWGVALTPSCSTVGSPLLALLPVSEWLLCLSLSLWPFHLLWVLEDSSPSSWLCKVLLPPAPWRTAEAPQGARPKWVAMFNFPLTHALT